MTTDTLPSPVPTSTAIRRRGVPYFRWVIGGLLFLAAVLNYVDRQALALLKPTIMADLKLGDHDYANGVAPDLDWNADRMETWVKAIKPVCNDPQFQARYPTLATDVTPLARAAFGRDPTADEIGAFDDVKLGQLDGAGQYRMVCLAVLSSLEFVAD